MLKKRTTRGSTLIAIVFVLALVALAAAGVAYLGFGFMPDASWAEGI
jgi:hypothetical protein